MKPASGLRGGPGVLFIAVIAATSVVVAACSSAVGGNGYQAPPSTTAVSTSAPSSVVSSSAGSTAPSASATPQLVTNITGTGTLAGTYRMSLWARDVIDDCGAHSYGQPIIAYFSAHPCRSATRRLWTMPLNGRTLAVSVVSVSAQVTKVNENPDFQYAQQLADLENADGTGSVKDLLREGSRIPGAGASIPANEVFSVIAQDGLVVIMDVWYVTGATNPKDADLMNVEADLSFSDAAAPDAD